MSKLDYGKPCGIIVVLFGLGVTKGTVMQLAAGVVSYMETTIKATYLFRSLWKWECFPFALFSVYGFGRRTATSLWLGRGRDRVDCGRWASSSTGLSVQWHHRFRLKNKSMFVSIRQECQRAPQYRSRGSQLVLLKLSALSKLAH
jgi:hypothetical protein